MCEITGMNKEMKDQMLTAAETLYDDYLTDKELTAFTVLDPQEYYEFEIGSDLSID